MSGDRIETLIGKNAWKAARRAIEKQLDSEPDDHWLWSRLSTVKYEQLDYQGALDAAESALKIVPDCPLALWSYAGALDMLGRTREAGKVYAQLLRRGLEQLKQPDEDANECWEGADWTRGLVIDCIFRIAGGLAQIGQRGEAVEWYKRFLTLLDSGAQQGIYSREDAVARLKKLEPRRKTRPDVMETAIRKLERVMA